MKLVSVLQVAVMNDLFIFACMLTKEEEGFLEYWKEKRESKKKLTWRLAAGLPMGAVIAIGISVNYFSGWYKRATMQMNVDASGILAVLIALIGIVIFIAIFSARHKWEMNEQHYNELLMKKNKE